MNSLCLLSREKATKASKEADLSKHYMCITLPYPQVNFTPSIAPQFSDEKTPQAPPTTQTKYRIQGLVALVSSSASSSSAKAPAIGALAALGR